MARSLLISFVFVLATMATHAQTDTANLIPWKPGSQLTWDDFQGTPNTEFWAFTYTHLSYRSKRNGDKYTAVVTCTFDKKKSWRKTEKALTPYLLLHEQLHFLIAEIHARRTRKAFADYLASHKAGTETNSELSRLFNEQLEALKKYNVLYDKETDHSKNKDKQEEWQTRLTKEASELADYASQ